MQHSGLNWLTNDLQAFFVSWAALPYKVLTEEMARHVSGYCIHSLGDFQEILALYLSEDVLNLYMNVGGNFCLNHYSRYFLGRLFLSGRAGVVVLRQGGTWRAWNVVFL